MKKIAVMVTMTENVINVKKIMNQKNANMNGNTIIMKDINVKKTVEQQKNITGKE